MVWLRVVGLGLVSGFGGWQNVGAYPHQVLFAMCFGVCGGGGCGN